MEENKRTIINIICESAMNEYITKIMNGVNELSDREFGEMSEYDTSTIFSILNLAKAMVIQGILNNDFNKEYHPLDIRIQQASPNVRKLFESLKKDFYKR